MAITSGHEIDWEISASAEPIAMGMIEAVNEW